MQRFGLSHGAQILEPSMGVGHFFGLMPDELAARQPPDRRRTRRHHGADRETPLSGLDDLRERLRRDAAARQFLRRRDRQHSVRQLSRPRSRLPRQPALTRTIHDYFLAKSLDKLRAGGVMALITSRYTMDKQDSTIRRYLADRADLVGAIRLPNTAFKANAGTEVTTDILFLQKRAPGAPARARTHGGTWRPSIPRTAPISVNEYFARHPEMMLGEMRLEGTMYRSARADARRANCRRSAWLHAVASLPGDIYHDAKRPRAPPDMSPATPADIDGSEGRRLRRARRRSRRPQRRAFRTAQACPGPSPRASAACWRCATPSASSSTRSSTMRPKSASPKRASS